MHGLAEEMRSAFNAVVNAVERRTGIDLDRDGDVGVAGSSRKSEPAGKWMEKATGTPAFYGPEMCVKGGAPGPLPAHWEQTLCCPRPARSVPTHPDRGANTAWPRLA